jgi:hypothetical protein
MTSSKIRQKYEPPKVVTYQEDEILKQMGPVGGCTGTYDPYAAPMNPFGQRLDRRYPGKRGRKYRSSLRSMYNIEEHEDI